MKNKPDKTAILDRMKRLAIEIETIRLKRLHGEYVPMRDLIAKKREFKKLQDQYKRTIYDKTKS